MQMIIHKSVVTNEKKTSTPLAFLVIFLLLFNYASYLLADDANAQTENIQDSVPEVTHDMCNCIIFRLDDVNSNLLPTVQLAIMNEFISKNQSLSLGLIMHNIDLDSAITGKIKEGVQKGLFELDVHGWDHVAYTQLSKEEQLGTLQQANDKMNIIFGHYSQTFIPPYNKFDGDTISVLKSSGIRIISSDTSTDKTNYFIADGVNQSKSNDVLYHLPSVATFKNDNGNGTWIKVPIQTILARSDNAINKYGYAVVLLHPQNFAKMENGVYVAVVDEHEIKYLSSLIDSIKSQDLKITTSTNAVGLDKTYLPANTVPEVSGIEITVLIISIVSVIAFTTIAKKGFFRHF